MKSIAFLEANSTGTTHAAMELAQRHGYRAILLTNEREFYQKVPANPLLIADEVIDVDSYNAVAILRALTGVQLDGLIAFDDYRIPVAAICAAAIGLPTGNVSALLKARYKDLTRQSLSNMPDAVPFSRITGREMDSERLAKMEFPVIAKPIDESGSVSIQEYQSLEELLDGISQRPKDIINVRGYRRMDDFIVEKCISGQEYSCELYFDTEQNRWISVGITEKLPAPLNAHVEAGHIFPADISVEKENKYRAAVIRWLDNIKLVSGAAHVEFKVDPDGVPRLIEINPRLPGGNITDLVYLVTGENLLSRYLNFHLLNPFSDVPRAATASRYKVAATLHFSSSELYGAEQIGALEAHLNCMESVLQCRFTFPLDSQPYTPKSNYDRVGYAVLAGKSHSEISDQIRDIRDFAASLATTEEA